MGTDHNSLSSFSGCLMKTDNKKNAYILAGIFIILLLLTACPTEIPTTEIHLTNSSPYSVIGLYIAEKETEIWSDNLIVDPVEPDGTRIITGVTRMDSQIKAVFLNGTETFENILNHNLSITSILNLNLKGE